MNKDVIAQLAIAARGWMEKEGRWFYNFFTRPGKITKRPIPIPPNSIVPYGEELPEMVQTIVGPRRPHWGRIGGAAAAGTFGGMHMYENAQMTEGRSWNPFTWYNPNSRQQVHENAFNRWKSLDNDINARIDDALLRGDLTKADALQQRLDSGSYRTGGPGLFGLNPFASRSMQGYGDIIRDLYSLDQAQDQRIRQRMQQRNMTLDVDNGQDPLNTQLRSIRDRMSQARQIPGISSATLQPPIPIGKTRPTFPGHWQAGPRPGYPGQVYGYALNPYDFRRNPDSYNVWPDVIRWQGPLTR
mgnify:CR=1 FL=1